MIAGDLLVIRSLKPVTSNRVKNHPLAWQRSLVTPALGEPVAPNSERLLLAIPLVVTAGHVSARLALLFEDRELAEVPVHFGESDNRGGLMGLIELPIADLPPAEYQLRLTLEAAGHEITRFATVVLAPSKHPCQ